MSLDSNQNQNRYNDPHHSFSVAMAAEYGVNEALLIHHFQHWIMLNQRMKKNFHDGHTWTYQTLDWITAHFPYFSRKAIERLINKLVGLKVLKKGNYNKSSWDKTVWYAFVDEEKFLRKFSPIENADSPGISRNREMEIPESRNGDPGIETAIPDTETDTETNTYKNKQKDPGPPQKEAGAEPPAPPDEAEAAASALADWMAVEIKKVKEDFSGKVSSSWIRDCKRLLRLRPESWIIYVLKYSLYDKFWCDKILSPAKILKHLDTLEIQIKKNRGNTWKTFQTMSNGSKANSSDSSTQEQTSAPPGLIMSMLLS